MPWPRLDECLGAAATDRGRPCAASTANTRLALDAMAEIFVTLERVHLQSLQTRSDLRPEALARAPLAHAALADAHAKRQFPADCCTVIEWLLRHDASTC